MVALNARCGRLCYHRLKLTTVACRICHAPLPLPCHLLSMKLRYLELLAITYFYMYKTFTYHLNLNFKQLLAFIRQQFARAYHLFADAAAPLSKCQ
jgi:hypothetical protein